MEVTRLPSSRWRAGGIALFSVAAFLLLSMGGAIVAAPVTVPLMFVATIRHPNRPFRIVGAALIGATIAEAAWALTYLGCHRRARGRRHPRGRERDDRRRGLVVATG